MAKPPSRQVRRRSHRKAQKELEAHFKRVALHKKKRLRAIKQGAKMRRAFAKEHNNV